MPSLEAEHKVLLDETLDFNKSEQYKLSILISKNGLSFVILDEQAKKIIAYKYQEIKNISHKKEYCFFLNRIFDTDEFLKYKYKKISIVYQSSKSITIPSNLYLEDYKEQFFNLNLGLDSQEIILSNSMPRLSAVKLFSIPKCIYEAINSHLQNFQIYHQSIFIIQSVLKNKALNTVYLNIDTHFFDLHVFNDKNLILDNSFKYKTKEDLLYYLLYTFEQLSLDSKKQKIILYSNFDVDQSMISTLQKYFGNLTMATLPKVFSYSYLFSKKDSLHLVNQILALECE